MMGSSAVFVISVPTLTCTLDHSLALVSLQVSSATDISRDGAIKLLDDLVERIEGISRTSQMVSMANGNLSERNVISTQFGQICLLKYVLTLDVEFKVGSTCQTSRTGEHNNNA